MLTRVARTRKHTVTSVGNLIEASRNRKWCSLFGKVLQFFKTLYIVTLKFMATAALPVLVYTEEA